MSVKRIAAGVFLGMFAYHMFNGILLAIANDVFVKSEMKKLDDYMEGLRKQYEAGIKRKENDQ